MGALRQEMLPELLPVRRDDQFQGQVKSDGRVSRYGQELYPGSAYHFWSPRHSFS